jgi:hypothetical protein
MKAGVVPDGTILRAIRVPLGYWEGKDTDDDLDEEIEKKRREGYPSDNIVYEDSRSAVLIQDGREAMRRGMTETEALDRLLARFFAWERPEIAEFRKAVTQFRDDLPSGLDALRGEIDDAYRDNAPFRANAAPITGHHEKQSFLKAIYETFYKVWRGTRPAKRKHRAVGRTADGWSPAIPDRPGPVGGNRRHFASSKIIELFQMFDERIWWSQGGSNP